MSSQDAIDLACPACGRRFPLAIEELVSRQTVACPGCGKPCDPLAGAEKAALDGSSTVPPPPAAGKTMVAAKCDGCAREVRISLESMLAGAVVCDTCREKILAPPRDSLSPTAKWRPSDLLLEGASGEPQKEK